MKVEGIDLGFSSHDVRVLSNYSTHPFQRKMSPFTSRRCKRPT